MTRAAMRPRAVIAIAVALSGSPAFGQAERTVRIMPERPDTGSAFVVVVELPGERAEAVEAVEPTLEGPAVYTGADVRPVLDADSGLAALRGASEALSAAPSAGTVVEYRFQAGEPGIVTINSLSIRISGRAVDVGTWTIDIAPLESRPARRRGSWRVQPRAWLREAFVATVSGPDGEAAAIRSFAAEGALVEPVPGRPSSFYVVGIKAGSVRLPPLSVSDGRGGFDVAGVDVAIKALPKAASEAKAVGVSWRLELTAPRRGKSPRAGELISWELLAIGSAWVGLSTPPSLSVIGPDGESIPVGSGTAFSSYSGSGLDCRIGARGAFVATKPGAYIIKPEPYAWFDASSGALRRATAPELRISALAGSARASTKAARDEVAANDEAVESVMEARAIIALSALAGKKGNAWSRALRAAEDSDWKAAKDAAFEAARVPDGTLSYSRLRGVEAIAAATVGFLAGDRAAAYCVFLRLERSAFPPAAASELAKAAALSFGNLSGSPYVLPPFGIPVVVGLAALAVAIVLRLTIQRPAKTAVAALVVVGVAFIALGAASALERSGPRFVSLGGNARTVPSALATGGYALEAGRVGRVLEATGDWLFVELDRGDAFWLARDEAATY